MNKPLRTALIKQHLRLCLVTHMTHQPFADYKTFLLQAIAGGATSVQLRAKNHNDIDFYDLASNVQSLLKPLNIPLIINDHVDVAQALQTAGIHVGQSDCSPSEVRRQLGADAWIGLSVETLADLETANTLDCIDYIAASSVFSTPTKTNCKTHWGLQGLQLLVARSRHPVVAIGGINQSNVKKIMDCGASGVAVVSAIHDAINPLHATQTLIKNMSGETHV